MSRFAKDAHAIRPAMTAAGPVASDPTRPLARTAEGGRGHRRDARSDLFLLAVTNMVGADTAYEAAGARDDRYRQLIHDVTRLDPAWVAAFLPWLRRSGYMRTAAVIGAVEYARAGGPGARRVIAATLARADEPGEALAYWLSRYGRRVPKAVKRGLADACVALYREDTPLRYDSARHTVRPGDVIDLCHPRPRDPAQAALFRHLIDRRHNRPVTPLVTAQLHGAGLVELAEVYEAESVAPEYRRVWLRRTGLPRLMGWERVGGWLPGGLDGWAWEQLVPHMGYMALVRNLRNIEQAQVGQACLAAIRRRLVDPAEVARSRMFPFRFWQAYHATDRSLAFGRELEQALTLACGNVPDLPGRTLVMVDVSGSMAGALNDRTTMRRYQAAGLFAAAVALRNPGRVSVHQYGTSLLPTKAPQSAVQFIDSLHIGGGTQTWACTVEAYRAAGSVYDRVVILTDEQSHDSEPRGVFDRVPVYVWNLAGYQTSTILPGAGRVVLGGLSDASFGVIPLIERGVNAGWPWEVGTDMPGAPDTDG